ncbi:hypothetical protein RhiirA1_485947, partial [Rhizophagus irregularis]
MNQNNLQNHQNDPTFSNLQSTVIQPEHSSSNTNYNDMNVIPSDNISHHFIQTPLSYDPQYVNPQHPISPQQSIENIPLLNMTSINPSQSEIL